MEWILNILDAELESWKTMLSSPIMNFKRNAFDCNNNPGNLESEQ